MSSSLRPHGLQPASLLCPWDSPGNHTGVDCHALLQGIFQTQGSNLCLSCLLHWQAGSLPLSERGSEVAQLCPTLCDPMDGGYQAPPSMGFSRLEFWSGLPFPSPGDLPDSGIKLASPALAGGFVTTEPPGTYRKTLISNCRVKKKIAEWTNK